MRKKIKSRRTLYARFFPRFERVTGNCEEFWLVERAVCPSLDWLGQLITFVLGFRQSFENRTNQGHHSDSDHFRNFS